ncbi:MAG: septum formation initiator family protein [Thermodesulfobacteriota bacterium]|nr:septum formation initiator family protein [Thermodesulfobacteriota bacterium]MDY6953700.1 septum formation initiator family protein [Thermodesulfobacteriota bacterium]
MKMKAKLIIVGGIVILLGFLVVIGLGDRGAVDLYELRQERDRLQKTNAELEEKNQEQYRTVERLRNDMEFVEDIARTELGMTREDEVVVLKKKE